MHELFTFHFLKVLAIAAASGFLYGFHFPHIVEKATATIVAIASALASRSKKLISRLKGRKKMNLLETLALNLFAAFLTAAIKNPKSVASEKEILLRVYNDLGVVLAGIGLTVTPATDPTTIIDVPAPTSPAPAPSAPAPAPTAPAAPIPPVDTVVPHS